MCLQRVLAFLFKGRGVKKLAATLIRNEKWKSVYRAIRTKRSEFYNMPKRQPCPLGHGDKKRDYKTAGGATYWCNICKASFLVTHP